MNCAMLGQKSKSFIHLAFHQLGMIFMGFNFCSKLNDQFIGLPIRAHSSSPFIAIYTQQPSIYVQRAKTLDRLAAVSRISKHYLPKCLVGVFRVD
jgi:hypothetical protein